MEKIKHIAQLVEFFMVICYGRFRKKSPNKQTQEYNPVAFLGAPNPQFGSSQPLRLNRITSCPGHPVILSMIGVSNRFPKRIVFRCHETILSFGEPGSLWLGFVPTINIGTIIVMLGFISYICSVLRRSLAHHPQVCPPTSPLIIYLIIHDQS